MLACVIGRAQVGTVRTRLDKTAKMAISAVDIGRGHAMQSMSAKDAKYGFGRLIDLARAEPVLIAKHGRPVVVVMSVEEYERLKNNEVGGEYRKLTKSETAHLTDDEEN
jgi:prevent-host-death family protein